MGLPPKAHQIRLGRWVHSDHLSQQVVRCFKSASGNFTAAPESELAGRGTTLASNAGVRFAALRPSANSGWVYDAAEKHHPSKPFRGFRPAASQSRIACGKAAHARSPPERHSLSPSGKGPRPSRARRWRALVRASWTTGRQDLESGRLSAGRSGSARRRPGSSASVPLGLEPVGEGGLRSPRSGHVSMGFERGLAASQLP